MLCNFYHPFGMQRATQRLSPSVEVIVMRTDPESHTAAPFVGWHRLARVCLCMVVSVLTAGGPVAAQGHQSGLPGLLNKLFSPEPPAAAPTDRLLTPADAPLTVTRQFVRLYITNAYDPSGVRYLAIKLGFRNSGDTDVTVNTKASQLLVGNDEFLRVQVKAELQGLPLDLPGEISTDVERLQGPSPLTVRANGQTAKAWLVFAKLPPTRDLPPLTLRLDTSAGKIEIDLTRIENEALTSTLERIGPSGRIGLARITGELNAINAPHFAKLMTGYAEQGVSRLVIAFDQDSRIGDELTSEWLINGPESDNDRLQFFPQWSGLVRGVVLANVPGQNDEFGEDNVAHSEAEAVQKVTRDFIPGLDAATLQREVRSGHPLFQRAILLNAGDAMANDDCDSVLRYLKSPEPEIRHAAIQSLRAAVAPQAVTALEEIVREGSREEAKLAFQSLNTSQQTHAHALALELASDPAIQKNIGLPMILRMVGAERHERWIPFLKQAWTSPDPIVRLIALDHLLHLVSEQRLPLLQAALTDKHVPIRDLAFQALVARRAEEEQPLFVEEALRRVKLGLKDSDTLTALREIRDPGVLPHLLKRIDAHPSEMSLVSAYVEIGGTAGLDEMVERYPRFPMETKSYLLRALSKAKHPESRRLAVAGLLSEDTDYHELCQTLLMEAGDAEAASAFVEAMGQALAKSDSHRSEELARCLGIMSGPAALQALEALQASDNPGKKKLATTGLAYRQYNSPVNSWLQAANQKNQQNDFEGAIELLNLALEIDPNSGRVYNAIGYAQLRMSKGTEAKPNFEKALKLTPEDHNPLTGIAICLALEGRCDEAIAMVDTPPLLFKHGEQQVYLYNVACVYGRSIEHLLKHPTVAGTDQKLSDYRKKAITFLQASVENGFEDLELLASDPDLAYLREIPEFKRLPKLIQERQLR